jgi:PAS domain S-box-containing protein
MLESTLHEKLEQLVLASPHACLGLDADGEIRACNSAASDLLGGSAHDLRGKPITALIPALPLRRNTTGYNVAYIGLWYAHGARRRLLGVHRDGLLPLEIGVTVVNTGKPPSYLVGMQRPAAESNLAERVRELQQSLDGAVEAAMITNRDGIVEYANSAFKSLTGYTRDEAIGRSFAMLRSARHGREFCAALWKSLAAGEHYHGLFVVRKKEGTIFYANLMMWPFVDSQGTATHFVALGTDAGERIAGARRVIEVEMQRAPATTHAPAPARPGLAPEPRARQAATIV